MSDAESNTPRTTRRAVLGGLALGGAGLVADTVRATPAEATAGTPLLVGEVNYGGTDRTSLYSTADCTLELVNQLSGSALSVSSDGHSPASAIEAFSRYLNGVSAISRASDASGVYGENYADGFGVAGRCYQRGGTGVLGESDSGVGLLGISGAAGTALKVQGRAQFSNSGIQVVPKGATKAVIALSGVTAASIVLATLQQHAPGCAIESAVPSADSFTIWLNRKAPTGGLKVGWFVLN